MTLPHGLKKVEELQAVNYSLPPSVHLIVLAGLISEMEFPPSLTLPNFH